MRSLEPCRSFRSHPPVTRRNPIPYAQVVSEYNRSVCCSSASDFSGRGKSRPLRIRSDLTEDCNVCTLQCCGSLGAAVLCPKRILEPSLIGYFAV